MLDGKGVPHGILSTEKTSHYKSYHTKHYVRPDPGHRLRGKNGRGDRHHSDPADGEHEEEAAAQFIRIMSEDRRTDRPGSHRYRVGEDDRDILP